MKRILSIVIAVSMLFTLLPSVAASAEEPALLIIDGQALQETPPIAEQGTWFVPLRAVAEPLEFRVFYEGNNHNVLLHSMTSIINFQIGGHTARVNNIELPIDQTLIRDGRVYVPISFVKSILNRPVHYNAHAHALEISTAMADPETVSAEVTDLLLSGQFETLYAEYFEDVLIAQMPPEFFVPQFASVLSISGMFVEVTASEAEATPAGHLVQTLLKFEETNLLLSIHVTGAGTVDGLFIQPAPNVIERPDTVTEEDIIVGADSAYPVGGTLTLPKATQGPVPAVVLVQGSGPSDRDETYNGYKPFRDLAWGLAEQGIAVLRYDKHTYVHAAGYTPEQGASITVREETVNDAIAASALLKADPRIDAGNVYIIGHSLGGMLAPRIDAEGGDFAGIISLAGSPRTLWEIIYDQNMAIIQAMDDNNPAKAMNEAFINEEFARAHSIVDMSEEEAKAAVVFGISAYYFKEMDAHSAAGYLPDLRTPILILQGEDDFQVYADRDYVLWQQLLADHPNAAFKLYPDLNHFFVAYSGPFENTMTEYYFAGEVDPQVVADIADWIMEQSR